MKLIKKIAAIMFAFIMVFTLSSNVNAEETTGTGKITLMEQYLVNLIQFIKSLIWRALMVITILIR